MPRKLRIKYYVEPDAAALAGRAAQYFTEMAGEAVADRGRARIAISGGSTPKAVFELLADPAQPWFSRMPWNSLDLYWVDERCVPPGHQDSNYRMAMEAGFSLVPIPKNQIHRMPADVDDIEQGAMQYEKTLAEHLFDKGFDLAEIRELTRIEPLYLDAIRRISARNELFCME